MDEKPKILQEERSEIAIWVLQPSPDTHKREDLSFFFIKATMKQ